MLDVNAMAIQVILHVPGRSLVEQISYASWQTCVVGNVFSIIIIIKNECHSNIIVDRLQGCSHSKKLRESESESRSSKVV